MKKLFLIPLFVISFIISKGQNIDSLSNDKNEELNTFIKNWWKTPYRFGGTTKRGIDCSAFTQKLFLTVYKTQLPRVASMQYKLGKAILEKEAKEGDLIFFTSKGPSGWHVGVYLADGMFVHSASKNGVFINSINDSIYSKRVKGFRRVL